MSEQDGGPAFPTEAAPVHRADHTRLREAMGWSMEQASRVLSAHPGMTLRDYFAAAALANPYAASESCPKLAARWAYDVADAMLAERKEGRSDDK